MSMRELVERVVIFYNQSHPDPSDKIEIREGWGRNYVVRIKNNGKDLLIYESVLTEDKTKQDIEDRTWMRVAQTMMVAGIAKLNEITPLPQSYGDYMKSNPKIPERCELTDERLVEAVEQWNRRMCKSGGKDWMLTIPADVNRDPDILIDELCERFKEKTNTQSTTLIKDEDEFIECIVTACCKIGPITSENYCPQCGKKITKTNPHSEGIGESFKNGKITN